MTLLTDSFQASSYTEPSWKDKPCLGPSENPRDSSEMSDPSRALSSCWPASDVEETQLGLRCSLLEVGEEFWVFIDSASVVFAADAGNIFH